MTFEYADKGAPAVSGSPDPDSSTAISGFVARLRDSIRGLGTAAELVEDEALTRFIAGLIERREATLDSIVTVVTDTKRQSGADSSGSVSEAVRRGWMRLADSVGGDDIAIVNTVIDGEQDLLDETNELLALDLPRAVADRLRSLAGEIGADITRLSEWARELDAGDSQ